MSNDDRHRAPPVTASILELRDVAALRTTLRDVVCTSGGYDPIHPGHISCLLESRRYGETLIAIVNDDTFLRNKKGREFQDVRTRCAIVAAIRGVDFVVPFAASDPDDSTVCEALRVIRPDVFTKGGDRRDMSSIPEWTVCQELGIRLVSGVGLDKSWSSSDTLRAWTEFSERKRSER